MRPPGSLRRLRVAFALLAIALLAPTALLVDRALRGVAAEREARQRAVAERVFDEMERALSSLVAREEARPVESWEAERLTALPDDVPIRAPTPFSQRCPPSPISLSSMTQRRQPFPIATPPHPRS